MTKWHFSSIFFQKSDAMDLVYSSDSDIEDFLLAESLPTPRQPRQVSFTLNSNFVSSLIKLEAIELKVKILTIDIELFSKIHFRN